MHHFGEAAVFVRETEFGFVVRAENHVTGARVTISLLLYGFYEDPSRKFEPQIAQGIGGEFAHMLRSAFS